MMILMMILMGIVVWVLVGFLVMVKLFRHEGFTVEKGEGSLFLLGFFSWPLVLYLWAREHT